MLGPFRKTPWITIAALLLYPSTLNEAQTNHQIPPTKKLEELVIENPQKPEHNPITYEQVIQRDQNRVFNILLPDKIFNGYMEPYGTLFVVHSPGLEYNSEKEWIGSPEEGDDIEIARVREIREYQYFLNGPFVCYEQVSSSVCRCSRNGFGFEPGSNRTPTGFRQLVHYNIEDPYQPVGESGLYSFKIAGHEITDENNIPIYPEKRGLRTDLERQFLGHGLPYEQEMHTDIGSYACVHLRTDYGYYMWDTIAQEPTYCLILGQKPSDLPERDHQLILQNKTKN